MSTPPSPPGVFQSLKKTALTVFFAVLVIRFLPLIARLAEAFAAGGRVVLFLGLFTLLILWLTRTLRNRNASRTDGTRQLKPPVNLSD